MAITYVRISTLPSLVSILKSAVPVVLNQSYLIAEENQFSISNASGYKGEFLDQIGYQVSEDDIEWSNEGFIQVKELVATNTPESVNDVLAATENTSYDLEAQALIPINGSTDRIKITNISGNGIPLYNGSPLSVNDVIYWHNFGLLGFDTKDGGGLPYAVISYQCGNHLGYNTVTTYTITINVASLGEIAFVSNQVINDTVDVGTVENRITDIDLYRISKGLIGTQAKVNVDINSPMFGDSVHNSVVIRYGSSVLTKTVNEIFDIFVDIGSDGKADIQVEHVFVNVNGTITSSTVTLVVTEIDGLPANVSATDTVISTANFN